MDRALAFLFAYLCPGFLSAVLPFAGPILGGIFGNSSGSGGGASGAGQQYVPTGLGGADQGWQQAFGQSGNIANQAYGGAYPGYQQSLNQQNAINYQPYAAGAGQAGQLYGESFQNAGNQANQYGQAANMAQGQQQALYGAGNSLWNTANDPQQALYGRTQQQLTDQVRAGQAARGLGNSAVGAGLEDQANSNFNIDWQNAQLQRQMQGAQGLSALSNAGGAQGQLYGANLAGQAGAMDARAQNYQQSYQVPIQGQQYAAAQPGAAAGVYAGQLGGLQSLYGNAQAGAIPYMNNGQGAQQANYTANTAQNTANTTMYGDVAKGLASSYNTPGSWLNNAFGGTGSNAWGQTQAANDTAGLANAWANYTPG